MSSVKFYLGQYVSVRRRKDGSSRVLFEVPPARRPSGWPPTIPLPLDRAIRNGNLADESEVAAIRKDAAKLYAQLTQNKVGASRTPAGSRNIRQLVRQWQTSSAWNDLKPRTQKGYEWLIGRVLQWTDAMGNPDPTMIGKDHIEGFLRTFNDRPTLKIHMRKVVRLIMEEARHAGWRTDNPCDLIKIKKPKAKVGVWEQADVDHYVEVCERVGRRSIALVILLEWEIGQRLTDVRAFRQGAEYDAEAGMFRFDQSKTESRVSIPVSPKLRAMLKEAADGALFLFRDERTGKAYTEQRLSKMFAEVRDNDNAEREKGGVAPWRYLVLRWLRHSCVVQLARAGCTVPEIAAITGHALSSVTSILEFYLQRDSTVAENAQRKRGLI